MRFKLEPYISVANDAELAGIVLLGPFFYCRGGGLQYFVVRIRSRSFRVKRKTQFGRFDFLKEVHDRIHIAGFVWLLRKNITGIESKAEVVHIFNLHPKVSPNQLFLKLPDHSF